MLAENTQQQPDRRINSSVYDMKSPTVTKLSQKSVLALSNVAFLLSAFTKSRDMSWDVLIEL